MKTEKVLNRFKSRMTKEAVIKSLLFGFAAACVLTGITSLLSWYFASKLTFLPPIVFAVTFSGVSALLYFLKFKPTLKSVAVRVDELGLEERIITMAELENDDSYMAKRQREDTIQAVKKVNEYLLPVAVSAVLIVCVCFAAVFSGGATVAYGLEYYGIIPSGQKIVNDIKPEDQTYYVIKYKVGKNGSLYCPTFEEHGSSDQRKNGYRSNYDESIKIYNDGSIEVKVKAGEQSPMIYAKPDEGFVFSKWSDGKTVPFRFETPTTSVEIKAEFEEGDFDVLDYLKRLEKEYGKKSDSKYKPYNPSGSGVGGGGNGGGGSGTAGDLIIDGNTYYGDYYLKYMQEAIERINADPTIPESVKKAIIDYYKSIKTDSSDTGTND